MKAMRTIGILILLLVSGFTSWSQTDRLDSLLYEVLGNDREIKKLFKQPSAYCYLYGGLAGDSKTFYAGREIGEDMYALNGSLYFLHSKGFYLGTSGSWYSQSDPHYSTTIATAGYLKALNRKNTLIFRASYNRYFYNSQDAETSYVFKNNLGTSLSLRNKWIGGRLSLNFLFGEEFGMNATPGIFSRIALVRFGRYNKIQLEPEVSLFFGSESVEYASAGSLSGQMSGSQPSVATEDVYGLLNTQFYLPVCIYIGGFDIELGYSVNIPTTQDENISYPISSFFSISLGYMLSLN
ncbi:MAG: hypothetical protein JW973_13715 [Bacteroidales bacterium]|nr:hypothetical protein [Bacteroidales bacterium]